MIIKMGSINTGFAILSLTLWYSCCFAVDGDCIVNNMAVQEDFDLDKFLGKWYEFKWYTTTVFQLSQIYLDYVHYYVQTEGGNITNYMSWRRRDDKRCEFGDAVMQQTSTSGKLIRTDKYEDATPYWILDTDYTQYAFVYGCKQIFDNGTCGASRAGIWLRTPQAPAIVAEREQAFYNKICISGSAFRLGEKTNECEIPKGYKMNPDQNCKLGSFQVQENFNKEMFAGVWYNVIWTTQANISPSDVLSDFEYEFILEQDGTFTIYLRGRGSNCVYNKNVLTPTTAPGKYIYSGAIDVTAVRQPFWVIQTDYDDYFIDYGCTNITNDECSSADVGVWSRRHSLSPTLMYRANSVLQELCLNPAAVFSISHKRACPPPWRSSTCPTSAGSDTVPSYTAAVYMSLVLLLCFCVP